MANMGVFPQKSLTGQECFGWSKSQKVWMVNDWSTTYLFSALGVPIKPDWVYTTSLERVLLGLWDKVISHGNFTTIHSTPCKALDISTSLICNEKFDIVNCRCISCALQLTWFSGEVICMNNSTTTTFQLASSTQLKLRCTSWIIKHFRHD